MSLLWQSCLPAPIYETLTKRYQDYLNHGATVFSAGLSCLLTAIAWLFLKLESPAWQSIRDNHRYWFPHISTDQPRLGDSVRYLLQSLWLTLFYSHAERQGSRHWLSQQFAGLRNFYYQWLNNLPHYFKDRGAVNLTERKSLPRWLRISLLAIASLFASLLALLCISQPFELSSQFIFVVLLWLIAISIGKIPGRLPSMMLIVLSITISCRYIWWRYNSTLNWGDPISLTCGVILIAAETYAWLVLLLGYFQTIWPLNRKPVSLPTDSQSWPNVDILVPTYNEDLSIVKSNIYASLGIDWPQDKLHIYLLDDGNRPEFKAFAEQVGIHYVARPSHEHAKAGNINYALQHHAHSEFVAIFDCDHVPTRSFLQLTMGWFLKEQQLAMLQTPHHFFSPDPFERNLGRFRKMPNENTLFYGLVQDGNDMWDATFFCGSCAVVRRSALDTIGGIATETVTEDAHTSLKLHRKGYTSAYIRIPQAAGLATESLSTHIGQRIRWARGMTQIFRLDNPLFGKGLKLGQRLCYVNAMLHFLSGLPRLIFLTAPLAYLLLHAYIIYAPGLAIALYVLPHMIHSSLTNSRIQGKYRHSFWSEIYETVLAWYIARPTTMALLNPRVGKFNVTAKGGLIEETHFDWTISRPYLLLVLLNIIGLVAGIWRLVYEPNNEIFTILLNMTWVTYNLLILGGAIAVAIESKQIRKGHRIEMAMPAAIVTHNGHIYSCTLKDYSEEGIGIELAHPLELTQGQSIDILLKRGQQEFSFPITIVRCHGVSIGAVLDTLTTEQHIAFTQCTFARADTWALWQNNLQQDKPLESLQDVLKLGFRGYLHLSDYTPSKLRFVFKAFTSCIKWGVSIAPHNVGKNGVTPPHKPLFAQL